MSEEEDTIKSLVKYAKAYEILAGHIDGIIHIYAHNLKELKTRDPMLHMALQLLFDTFKQIDIERKM